MKKRWITILFALALSLTSAAALDTTLPEATLAPAQKEEIAKLLKGRVQDEPIQYIELNQDLIYVVCGKGKSETGGAYVRRVVQAGELALRVVSAENKVEDEAALLQYKANDEMIPNITVSYANAGADKVSYLQNGLQNINGVAPNDAAKQVLANYIETAVAEGGMVTMQASNNTLKINGRSIADAKTGAEQLYEQLMQALGEVKLNKQLALTLRIRAEGMVTVSPMQVSFEKSILDQLGQISKLQIMLDEGKHSISVDAEMLQAIEGDTVLVQMSKTGEKVYSVSFLTPDGTVLDKIGASVGFMLPSDSELASVQATYKGGVENWGGQYDAKAGTIEFTTPYTGSYELTEGNVNIADIASLDEQTQSAIRFMVSKGYVSVDQAGNYLPDEALTRYDFTESLVRMFFSLDRNLTTRFADVPQDSPYYAFVASGEQSKIISGISETEFAGDSEMPNEQAITFAARTLADKKGYTYPEDIEQYLTFPDKDALSEWAKQTTALAVREKMIDAAKPVRPKENMTRAEAALMLYNLFMLLYETPQTDLVSSDDGRVVSALSKGIDIAGQGFRILMIAALVLLVVGFVLLQLKKRMQALRLAAEEQAQKQKYEQFATVSLGRYHSGALTETGALFLWGDNAQGALGDGSTISARKPVFVQSRVQSFAMGWGNTALITVDHELFIWGDNARGTIGDGTVEQKTTPAYVMPNVAQVVLGQARTAALRQDGALFMWGMNSSGQLGLGSTIRQMTPENVLNEVSQISLFADGSSHHTAAIKTDGSLWMWGANESGQLGNGGEGESRNKYGIYQATPIEVMQQVRAVSVGGYHTAAIKQDGSLWAWGRNRMGQLGDGSQQSSNLPVRIMDGVSAVLAGFARTFAIKEDGSLWVWGAPFAEDGEPSDQPMPPTRLMDEVDLKTFEAMGVPDDTNGRKHYGILKTDGTLWLWGANNHGQLGNGEQGGYQPTPTQVMDEVESFSLGRYHTAVRKTDGTIWLFGYDADGQIGCGSKQEAAKAAAQTAPVQIIAE